MKDPVILLCPKCDRVNQVHNRQLANQICKKCGEILTHRDIVTTYNLSDKRKQNLINRTVEAEKLTSEETTDHVETIQAEDHTILEQLLFQGETFDFCDLNDLENKINQMRGIEFEHFLGVLFRSLKFEVEITPASNDQGADLLITDIFGKRIAIQAKKYSDNVGNYSIQQLLGGMLYYGCEEGVVITTTSFTNSAYQLASKSNNIYLWDGEKLKELCYKAFS